MSRMGVKPQTFARVSPTSSTFTRVAVDVEPARDPDETEPARFARMRRASSMLMIAFVALLPVSPIAFPK